MPVWGDDIALARAIAQKAQSLGGRAYFVGGYVRDAALGVQSKDVDLEVYGLAPEALFALMGEFGEAYEKGAAFRVFGLKHSEIDVAMPRRESRTGAGHRDFAVAVDPFLPPQVAASRRDFTINAMMMDVLSGEILDFFGGRRDLQNHIIRHVSDASFADDALRAYRAAQFAARLEATVAPETVALIRQMDVSALSRERVFDEMKKALLRAARPGDYFCWLRAFGLLPEPLLALARTPQNPRFHPEGDVFAHTVQVLNRAAVLRGRAAFPLYFMLAALCHDIGKPAVTAVRDGRIVAYRHEEAGAPIARTFLETLTDESALLRYVENMVLLHMRPNRLAQDRSRQKSTRRLFDASVCPEDLILLSMADAGNAAHEPFLRERLEDYRAILRLPMVTGRDLLAAGIPAGPHMSALLARARTLHFAGMRREVVLQTLLQEYRQRAR